MGMARKTSDAKGRGRPKLARPMATQLNVRVDQEIRDGIEAYRTKYGSQFELRELSDAIRHMLKRVLREEGMFKG